MNKRCMLAGAVLIGYAGATWSCGPQPFCDYWPTLHPQARRLAADANDDQWLEPFRFLDPFRLAGFYPGERMARLAYGTPYTSDRRPDPPDPNPVAADLDAMDRALVVGGTPSARQAARQAIDRLLSLPAPLAAPWGESMRRAVEFLEIEPALGDTDPGLAADALAGTAAIGGTPLLDQTLAIRAAPFDQAAATLARFPDSPRRPSLELAALRNRMTAEIGVGWPGKIQGTTPETWAGLRAAHEDWLARYPEHPLADLARLQTLRVLYLQGDGAAAWDLLLGLYPRRPARALWEMRHLIRNGLRPQGLDLAALPDPVLASALLGQVAPPSPAQWNALWRRSEAAAGAPWAINLQERLLLAAASDPGRGLPDAFPSQPARPSELWAQLRTLALIRVGRHPAALRQAERLDPTEDPRSADVLATALVDTGQVIRAATLPALDQSIAAYLLRVAADDTSLAALAKGDGPRAALAAEALACRRLGDGDWAAGARVLDAAAPAPAQAALWRAAGRYAADRTPAGRLALARWLLGQEGKLFLPVPARGNSNPGDPEPPKAQQARLDEWARRCGERQRALDAYGAALAGLDPGAPEAVAALAEADRLYNKLLRWDPLFSEGRAARQIRAAGKGIRAQPAGH
ncbi:hypothetical protein [uncultured Lamprocystis sp.]|jgi:hypothetical protein|uniref:hypothetical protein n=1 Tax=uncultured Lamprocystis sp. TaxID=543132 RepID=UPI0025DB3B20|nr:hypothetical protein [uncultured Lamprocystis sp.]